MVIKQGYRIPFNLLTRAFHGLECFGAHTCCVVKKYNFYIYEYACGQSNWNSMSNLARRAYQISQCIALWSLSADGRRNAARLFSI